MSSILTNNSAMVALQTLTSINKNLADTQSQISTGKMVANAKDNSAIWAISKVMESDVAGFKAISSSLSLGQSTVAVARQASETVTDLLTQMKDRIVASQESNVDREKLQEDITALKDQIGAVVGAAQFNGLNLLQNSETTTATTNVDGTGTTNVLASLDRSATGVAASDISVSKQDLTTRAGAEGTGGALAGGAVTASGTAAANGGTASYTIVGDASGARTQEVMAGDSYSVDMGALFDGAVPSGTPFADAEAATTGKGTALYVARDGDTTADIAQGLADIMNFRFAEQGLSDEFNVTVSGSALTITNNSATALAAAAAGDISTESQGTTSGGMALLAELDATTEDGASAALVAIEGLISSSIDSAAAFGSAQGRIDTQMDFVSGLTDALKSGIGSLVDANMEEASARLQALQVQQQLGVQSLSIANQAPQTILSLFR